MEPGSFIDINACVRSPAPGNKGERGLRVDRAGYRFNLQGGPVLPVVTVLHAIQEVDRQPDEEPDDEELVGEGIEARDEEDAGSYTEKRYQGDARTAERAREVRLLEPED